MEYRRRSRRKRANRRGYSNYASERRGRNEDGASFGGALLILLLTAGLIYLLLGTSIGTWIAQNIFSSCGSETITPDPTHQVGDGDTTPEPAGIDMHDDMKFPSLDVFTLQMGVYSDTSTASGLISSLKSLGAAGYVFDSGNGYRVLASCYDTEAAAKSVCERLRDQNYECVVYPISIPEVNIGVTCDETKLEAIRIAVDYSYTVITDLSKEVISFDSDERSVEYGHAIGNEILSNVKNVRNSIAGISDSTGLIPLLDKYFMNLEGMLTTFISTNSENRVEVSGMLKYLHLDAICNYISMLSDIKDLS